MTIRVFMVRALILADDSLWLHYLHSGDHQPITGRVCIAHSPQQHPCSMSAFSWFWRCLWQVVCCQWNLFLLTSRLTDSFFLLFQGLESRQQELVQGRLNGKSKQAVQARYRAKTTIIMWTDQSKTQVYFVSRREGYPSDADRCQSNCTVLYLVSFLRVDHWHFFHFQKYLTYCFLAWVYSSFRCAD